MLNPMPPATCTPSDNLRTRFRNWLNRLLGLLFLCFPAVLFLALGLWAFVFLGVGVDLFRTVLQAPLHAAVGLLGISFWAYTVWYSARLLVTRRTRHTEPGGWWYPMRKAKAAETAAQARGLTLEAAFPRLLGLLVYVLLTAAVLEESRRHNGLAERFLAPEDPTRWLWGYIGVGLVLVAGGLQLGRYASAREKGFLLKNLLAVRLAGLGIALGLAGWASLLYDPTATTNTAAHGLFAGGLVLEGTILAAFQGFRRAAMGNKSPKKMVSGANSGPLDAVLVGFTKRIGKKLAKARKKSWLLCWLLPDEDPDGDELLGPTFTLYGLLVLGIAGLYLVGFFNYRFATDVLGSVGGATIGLGVLIGLLTLVSNASLKARLNLHVLMWVTIWVLGAWFCDPYAVEPEIAPKDARPSLSQHFEDWVRDRRTAIEAWPMDSSLTEPAQSYPVFLVCTHGGASRSAYWTGRLLAQLHDTTGGLFSQHVYSLSGASGGNLGTAAYIGLLRAAARGDLPTGARLDPRIKAYLESDFFSQLVLRYFGSDLPQQPLRHVGGISRASALRLSFEENWANLPGENFMAMGFQTAFKDFCIRGTRGELLTPPALLVNTTEVNGKPWTISSVALNTAEALCPGDLLAEMRPGEDIRVSDAVLMGARFPYFSPAGVLKMPTTDGVWVERSFVDGGYFDNSGTYTTAHLLRALEHHRDSLCKTADAALAQVYKRLRFVVLHFRNSACNPATESPIHPTVNDLAVPIKALLGTYSQQTARAIQQLRLEITGCAANACETLTYGPTTPWVDFDLAHEYRTKFPAADMSRFEEDVPFNWHLSRRTLLSLDTLVHHTLHATAGAYAQNQALWANFMRE